MKTRSSPRPRTAQAVWLLLWALVGCPHGSGVPQAQTYQATVATAYGADLMASATEMEVVRSPGAWTVRTVRTSGDWVTGGVDGSFDSATPRSADPWPLTLHHAIAGASLRISVVHERPSEVLEPDSWVTRARQRAYQTELPAAALQSAEQLLVPDNQIRDLVRFFPGVPEADWTRVQRISGVEMQVQQACTQAGRSWVCTGELRSVDEAGPQVLDGQFTSELTFDAQGLVRLEERYDGTLVVPGPDGVSASDRPIGGRRQVVRQ